MIKRESVYTIREFNQDAKREGWPKTFQSYTVVYGLVRAGKIPFTKLGNRYLIRPIDVENYLSGSITPTVAGIRRID